MPIAPFFEDVFKYPIKEFKDHLEDADNTRIIFSGRYGIGKTTFLQQFFEQGHQDSIFNDPEKYAVFRLSPIKYSIAPTEDIVDYIKYDLIIEFLKKGYVLSESVNELIQDLPGFLKKNLLEVAKAIIAMIPKVGKEVTDVYEKIESLLKKFNEYRKEENTSTGDTLSDFLSEIEKKHGNPFVDDIITKIVRNIVNDFGGISVLIIDDLDRLDPEHIFRILNVFSVQFSDQILGTNNNKFGFQKIILVCDFNNIRNIFHYRYGLEADFIGYIDKFFSTQVFHFDNKPAIISILVNVFRAFEYNITEKERLIAYQLLFDDEFVYEVISFFIERGYISLRNILKLYGKKLNIHMVDLVFEKDGLPIKAFQLPTIMQLKIVNDYISDHVKLDAILDECISKKIALNGFQLYFPFLVMIATYRQGRYLASRMHGFHEIDWEGMELSIRFSLPDGKTINTAEVFFRRDHEGQDSEVLFEETVASPHIFWTAFKDSLGELRRVGYIK